MNKKNQIVNNVYRFTKLQQNLVVLAFRNNIQKYRDDLQSLVLNKINAKDINVED